MLISSIVLRIIKFINICKDIEILRIIKFINICKEYGGYNDIEILMNAQKEIYDDFGIKTD
ncbi:MAG: hypothetical protein ACOC35_15785 [Promethearchaeia archaeon]